MADNQKYRFISKPVAKDGKLSIGLGCVSFLLMLATIFISFFMEGKGDIILGAMGLCAIALAFYGFILGLQGLNQKKVDHKLSFIGTVVSGLAVILWLAIFVVGAK